MKITKAEFERIRHKKQFQLFFKPTELSHFQLDPNSRIHLYPKVDNERQHIIIKGYKIIKNPFKKEEITLNRPWDKNYKCFYVEKIGIVFCGCGFTQDSCQFNKYDINDLEHYKKYFKGQKEIVIASIENIGK